MLLGRGRGGGYEREKIVIKLLQNESPAAK